MGQRSWVKTYCLSPITYYLLPIFLLLTIHYSLFTNVYAFCFEEAGKEYGINPSLLKSIAQIESNLNPKAMNKNQNGSIDIGLMQINSFWIKTLGLDSNKLVSDPCYNTMIGAKVLKQCIDRYGYTWEAVGCYNATSTPKRVKYSWKIFNNLKAEGSRLKADGSGQQSAVSSQNKPNSELYFIVRDKTMEAQ
jgi:soluble lytic murein transglycosylase-like protein